MGFSHWAGNWLPLCTPILLFTHPSHIFLFCFALFVLICVQTTDLVHFPTVILFFFFWLVSFWFCVLKLPFPFLTQSCTCFAKSKINGSPGEELCLPLLIEQICFSVRLQISILLPADVMNGERQKMRE